MHQFEKKNLPKCENDLIYPTFRATIFSKERINYNEITPILLNELASPFVNNLKHLGNVLQSDKSMTIDCNKKRAIFISKIHSFNQKFYLNVPDVILKL